jgi:glycosyltransferase involved in cell wall biosynthesis
MSKYRGADILVEALRILMERGVDYHATITQEGELWRILKTKAENLGLPVDFPGFVEMPDLIRLYENCSVYVGAGREEPWGMRLNDALQCGAPVVVSRGMGGVQMIDRYKCGLDFPPGDSVRLADALEKMARNIDVYKKLADNAILAAQKISPSSKAKELIGLIKEWI